jgi:hypothetical protein
LVLEYKGLCASAKIALFQFIQSTPEPSFGNNVWDLGDLAPGVEHNILISGKNLKKVVRVH